MALVKPIVRFALRHGVMAPELVRVLKIAFLEVADESLAAQGEERNVSRLSILTGLSRREVKRELESDRSGEESVSLLSRVVGQWSQHPEFSTKPGAPRELSIRGDDSEFAELVRSVKPDLNSYTVLFGLQQAGAVEVKGEKAELIRSYYVPKGDLESGAAMLGQDISDLISSVEENLLYEPGIPNLHLTASFDNVAIDKLDEIRSWVLDRGTAFQEEVRDYIGKCDLDLNPRLHGKAAGTRVVVGAFSLVQSGNKK